MRKIICISIFIANLFFFNASAQNCFSSIRASCTEPNDYCIPEPSVLGPTVNDSWYTSHGLQTCLYSQPRSTWIMFQVASSGDLLIYIQQFSQYNNTTCSPDPNSTNLDIDFACWGPFPDVYDEDDFVTKLCNNTFTLSSSSLSSHRPSNGNHSNNNLGGYPVNSNPSNPNNVALTDCSYDASATEWCFLPNAQQGDWYLLLICNYNSSGTPGYFSFTTLHTSASGSSNYTGSTNCDLLNCLSTNEEMPCEGSEITLYCTVPASDLPSNVQYRWIAPDSTILATTTESSYALTVGPTMSGRYTLVLVGTTPERRGFIDITVQQTPVSINASEEVICKGDSVVLSTPYNLYYTPQYYGYYRWYHNSLDSSVICTDTSLVVYPEEDCNYIVKVKNGSTECTNTSTVHITVNPIPEVTITAQDEHLCYGESTSINANCSDNVTYRWSNGNTNASINVQPTETQTYTVTAKLREGAQCEKSDSITIYVDPQIHLTSEVIDAHCGQSVGKITMHATGGDGHFAFTSNPSTAVFIDSVASNVTAGSYLVTASDGMACTQSTTVDVADIPGPDPCFIFASTDNVNMMINNCTQGANNEYFWDFGDGVTSTETHPIHEYMEPGLYSVSMIVTDEFNCVDSLRQDYRINGPVYIANAFSPNGDGINDEIFVIGKSIQQEDFFWAIYDRHGSLVFLSVSPSIGWDGTILGGRDAQPGVYVYRLKYKDVNGSLFEKDGNITLIR